MVDNGPPDASANHSLGEWSDAVTQAGEREHDGELLADLEAGDQGVVRHERVSRSQSLEAMSP